MRRTTRTTLATSLLALGALSLAACSGGSGFDAATSPATTGTTPAASTSPLTMLIGSSGDAETTAVTETVAMWSASSGTKATVTVASDLNQELSQGFAAGTPADVFYLSTDALAGYAANGSLYPYGDKLDSATDFYPSLVKNFTYDDKLFCAPKDFSTLALVINTDYWAAAGLTDADIPTDWTSLEAAATKLTTADHVGLSFGPEYQRLGVFMAQAGGGLISEDGTTAVIDSPQNLEALTFVQKMLKDGVLKYPSDIDTGWGGEAFGSGKAAMTIEGNWIVGAMKNDYPDAKYSVVELPKGPAGQGTLQFTNCWGISADSKNQAAAVELVKYLTGTDQQLGFAKAFGVMPSIASAGDGFRTQFPAQSAFLDSAAFAVGMPTLKGSSDVITDFNGKIASLATGDPKAILAGAQANMQAAIDAKG